jgi:S1-C subfamily serine protease
VFRSFETTEKVVTVTEQSDESVSADGTAAENTPANAGAEQPPRIHTLAEGQSAADEQPSNVPTEHQSSWSTAQQYPGQPQTDASSSEQGPDGEFGQVQPAYPPPGYQPTAQYPAAGYGPYGPYGQAPYGQAGYGETPYGQAPYGQAPYGQAPYGQAPYGQAPYGQLPYGQNYWAPPPAGAKKHRHGVMYGAVAAAVAAAMAVGGVALAVDHANNSSQQTSASTPSQTDPFSQNGGTGNSGNGFGFTDPNGSAGSGTGSTGTTGQATATQSVGVVDINTTIDFGQGKAAGTGIVLTSDGEILTNNHVVEDSTAISVTIVSTGKTYTAKVVGTDPTDDVAVIQLQNASGLATAKLGDSSKVTASTAVTAVGNAGGTGGTPTAATGTVTALNQSITASDESGANSEQLTGMFQVNANIQAGDSGGPLYENAGGTIIGIDTAASTSSGGGRFGGTTTGTTGFAIPIAKATAIADQIEAGKETSTIHIGYPAFLGVQLSSTSTAQGAAIAGAVEGSAAAKAALGAGDTITAVDGKAVASATALSSIMATHNPGDQVKVSYTDASGQSHTVTLTLGQGPAD